MRRIFGAAHRHILLFHWKLKIMEGKNWNDYTLMSTYYEWKLKLSVYEAWSGALGFERWTKRTQSKRKIWQPWKICCLMKLLNWNYFDCSEEHQRILTRGKEWHIILSVYASTTPFREAHKFWRNFLRRTNEKRKIEIN